MGMGTERRVLGWPFVQARGEGRGSATPAPPPKYHIPQAGRPGLPTPPGTECFTGSGSGGRASGPPGGGGRALSASAQTLGYLGRIWSSMPSLGSCHLGLVRARFGTERKEHVPVPALISGSSAPFPFHQGPPGKQPPLRDRDFRTWRFFRFKTPLSDLSSPERLLTSL